MGGAVAARTGLVVSLVLVLGGCSSLASDRTGSSPEPAGPAPSPASTAPPSARPTVSPSEAAAVTREVGGLTIHHLDADGRVRTLEVEHFRR